MTGHFYWDNIKIIKCQFSKVCSPSPPGVQSESLNFYHNISCDQPGSSIYVMTREESAIKGSILCLFIEKTAAHSIYCAIFLHSVSNPRKKHQKTKKILLLIFCVGKTPANHDHVKNWLFFRPVMMFATGKSPLDPSVGWGIQYS